MKEVINWLNQELIRDFIHVNLYTDTNQILLNPPTEFKAYIGEIVDQIISRRKAKNKLPAWYENEALIMPPPLSLEQCSSPATAAYKLRFLKGNQLVDLTGGTGIDTLALSKHFETTTYVEHHPWLCEVFNHNTNILANNTIKVVNKSAEEFLGSFEGKADFFIDPARRDDHQKKVFYFENCSPNLIELLPVLREKAVKMLVKAAPMIDLSLGIHQLKHVAEVHIVAVKNEVKEVLFLLNFQQETQEPPITCANLESDHAPYTFTREEEKASVSVTGSLSQYLFEPNAAIMKAGAFKSIGHAYGLTKLGANTHLYTSSNFVRDFPGRKFKVLQAHCSRKDILRLLPNGQANVITKNHPLRADELKNKLKLKDGGDWFVIGYRDTHNKPDLLIARSV